jgi:hypothetical protein
MWKSFFCRTFQEPNISPTEKFPGKNIPPCIRKGVTDEWSVWIFTAEDQFSVPENAKGVTRGETLAGTEIKQDSGKKREGRYKE